MITGGDCYIYGYLIGPIPVTLYIQEGTEEDDWIEIGETQVDSSSELEKMVQMIQDVYGSVRVKGIDSLTGRKLITLYKR